MSALDRFQAKYESVTESGCWIWTASLDLNGYGQFSYKGKRHAAHRVSYELFKGPAPTELDHICRVRCCVNPDHLEGVTHHVNLMRGRSFSAVNAQKTHCPHGHLLAGGNLHIRPNGKRQCRSCIKQRNVIWNPIYRAKKRMAKVDSVR